MSNKQPKMLTVSWSWLGAARQIREAKNDTDAVHILQTFVEMKKRNHGLADTIEVHE